MEGFGSKSKINKAYFAKSNPSENKIENAKFELDELTKSIGSVKKNKEQDKGFVFSLSHFEEKNRASRGIKSMSSETTAPELEEQVSLNK